MKRITVIVLALLMVLALVPTVALADGETVNISTSDQLADAILNQADGQTWILAANTTFDLDLTQMEKYKTITINGANTIGSPPGFVFPITANNLTIKGGKGTVVTSNAVVSSGNWHNQNFITIKGNNVTLDGLTLIPNINLYYGTLGINKIVEVLGKNFTLKNIKTQPRTGADFSGSIYYNNGTDSDDVLENVYLTKGRITLTGKSGGTLTMTNVTIDFVNAYNSQPTFTGYWNPNNVPIIAVNVTFMMSQARMDTLTNLPASGVTYVSGDENTVVTAGVDPTYTIVIPAAVNFGTLQKDTGLRTQNFPVTAQNVLIENGKAIIVSVNSNFNMASGTTLLGYLLNKPGGGVMTGDGDTFAQFSVSETQTGSVEVDTDDIVKAGSYQGTMTFTIAYQ